MSVYQMSTFIEIVESVPVKDESGFSTTEDTVLHKCRAYKEVTAGGSERFHSGAAFSEELTTFQFRHVPVLKITTEHFITDEDGRYNITKVDNVSGKGMYVIVTGSLIQAAKG